MSTISLSSKCEFTKIFQKSKSNKANKNPLKNFQQIVEQEIKYDVSHKEDKYASEIIPELIEYKGKNIENFLIETKIKKFDQNKGTITLDIKIIDKKNPKNLTILKDKQITGFKKDESYHNLDVIFKENKSKYIWESRKWDYEVIGYDHDLYNASISSCIPKEHGIYLNVQLRNNKNNEVVVERKFFFNKFKENNISAYINNANNYFPFEINREMIKFANVDLDEYEVFCTGITQNNFSDTIEVRYTIISKKNRIYQYHSFLWIKGLKKFKLDIDLAKNKRESYIKEIKREDINFKSNEDNRYKLFLRNIENDESNDDFLILNFDIIDTKNNNKIYRAPFEIGGFIKTNKVYKSYNSVKSDKTFERKYAFDINEEDIKQSVDYDKEKYNLEVINLKYIQQGYEKPYFESVCILTKKNEPEHRSYDSKIHIKVYFYSFKEVDITFNFKNKENKYPSDIDFNNPLDVDVYGYDKNKYKYYIDKLEKDDSQGILKYRVVFINKENNKQMKKEYKTEGFKKIFFDEIKNITIDDSNKEKYYASHFPLKLINKEKDYECQLLDDNYINIDDIKGEITIPISVKKKNSNASVIKYVTISGFKKLENIQIDYKNSTIYGYRSNANIYNLHFTFDKNIYSYYKVTKIKLNASPFHKSMGVVQYEAVFYTKKNETFKFNFHVFGYYTN